MAAAMVRQHSGQRFRSGRFRGRHGSGEENVQLDFAKDPVENVKEILTYVIKQHSFSKAKKLGYLNVFVKLIDKCGGSANLGFPLRSILICLSVNLLHAPKEVRAGTLRVIKHLMTDDESVQVLLDLHLDYFIARSLDLCLDNEIERIHAQKLTRKFSSDLPAKMPRSLVQPLVAIGNDGVSERDRMVRASLACICELTYHNPDLVAHCGGISMLLRKILDCHQYPRINESIVSTILHLVNYPSTRHFVRFNTDLEQLIAPFTDCHFSYTGELTDQTSEDRDARFTASKMAIVTVMRSWPGIVRFCRPDGTGLQSLVGILYLPFTEIRQGIVELIYELFHLTLPEWTKDFNEALISIDPSKMVENWQLTEGFVANEGKTILPHTATVRPNLVENHLALLLSAWIGAGILDALVEVIITSENELFIRSVILLAELLHLANQLLPPECSHHSHYLPSLMALASSFDISESQRHQASLAVNYLDRIHVLKKRGPIPCSLYLDQLVKQSESYKDRPQSLIIQKDKLLDMHIRKRASSSEEVCMQTLRDTQVLFTKENKNWDWDLIEYVLKWPDDKLRKLEDQSHVRFIKRLVFFFKPTNHMFSRLHADHEFQRKFALAGCQLADFLVRCEQEEGTKILTDFLADIALCLSEVALQRIAPESVLSVNNVINTLSHYYFLFIGRFSMTTKGDRLLEKAGIYQHFLDIVSSAPQECYVKLISSCLYYGRDGNCRAVLSKALCAGSEAGRLYSTKMMRILLRAKVKDFSQWGIEFLVGQLYDQSRSVAMTALTILDEACEVKENLESVVKMKPSFLHLGEKGVMILCRYMSTPAGFKFLTDANYTLNELKKWHSTFNTRYVQMVEEMLNEALTTYEKTYEGSYTRRSSRRRQKKDVYVPTHLYGELVQHKESFNLLRQQTYIDDYFECIRCQELKTEDDILHLKTALWAVGHISMSSWGVSWLQEEKIVPEVIRLAEESAIYSIRGTCIFILGMVSSTREGAMLLSQYGWESRWNTRAEHWPLVEDRSVLLEDSMEDLHSEAAFSIGNNRLELGSPVSNLDYIAEERFQIGKPKNSCSEKTVGCDDDDDDDDVDSESGIHIPDVKAHRQTNSPEISRQGVRMKSQTLPLPGQSSSKHHFPFRSHTFRSIALPQFIKDRTKSVEHISTSHKDFRISHEHRSHSFHFHLKHKHKGDSLKHKNEPQKVKSVIKDDNSLDSVNAIPRRSSSLRHVKEESSPPRPRSSSEYSKHSSAKHVESSRVEHETETKPSDKAELGLVIKGIPSEVSTNASSADIVLKIVEPGDEEYKADTKIEQNKAASEQEAASNSIRISVTDTDLESDDKEPKNQNQSEQNKTSEIDHKVPKNENQVEHDQTESELEQNSDKTKKAEGGSSENLEEVKSSLAEKEESSLRKIGSLKDGRSSSSDSSKTSKSRTESFTTDSTTSGIGSYDSGHHGVMEFPSLSPIASSNSLDTMDVQLRHKEKKEHKDTAHHSSFLRRMSNLTRVPSIRRQSSPGVGLMPTSKFFDFSENAIMYTTARDAIGYATLRNLMKTRTISSDVESDYGLNSLYDNMGSMTSINRRPSIDSTSGTGRPSSLMFNMSGVSLNEMENPRHPTKASLYQQRPHTGKAEFMGITLPVDINMIFEVHEGEDRRTGSFLGSGISRQASIVSRSAMSRQSSFVDPSECKIARSESGTDSLDRLELESRGIRSRSGSSVAPTPLSSNHNVDVCIQCRGIRQEAAVIHPIDAAGKKISFDTAVGRTLVRKEIIQLVINLSSSVGVKGAEQGLLSLKQKFPKAFQDLCFYSEVSFMLGTCSFRLTARRFIQELFDDIDRSKLIEEAQNILGVEESAEKPAVLDRSVPEDFDGFEDFS
ncbi:rapamycin-insensitive companion of mTOR-like isoform X2 [Mercenaria mercenaria]|uniref:rapamycin-insensitive companion of mTOR-like isoform X2 n=1 Tax=Mercenaria mercenaria TaxID=6596 RepID=UPI00234FA0CC|nr:rapamycin-insensitive companion of mTOR-like isoform X2 [Mercenaria mercenaria]